jgi:hypothetical protein
MRVAVAIVRRLLMTGVAAGRNELIQKGGQVMLQSWLELNRTDRRRATPLCCSMPIARIGRGQYSNYRSHVEGQAHREEIAGSCESSPCRHHHKCYTGVV